MDGEFYGREPHDAYAWMRAHAPVYYDEANDIWAAASYAAVKAASVDTEAFSSAQGIRPKYPPLPMMIDFDAPEHVRRRRLVSEGFTPKRVRAMEDQLRLACDTILDTVCERGSCDFVADIAAPLPIAVIGDMLGVAPADRAELLEWSDVMLKAQGSPDPDAMVGAMHAFEGYTNYITPVLADRKATRQQRRPRRGAVPGRDRRRLARRFLAHPRDPAHPHRRRRDDASRHQRGHGGVAGPAGPAGPADRRSRGLMPGAVEEMLRWVSPIKNMARTATRDVELAGATIKEGQELLLLYPSANRDETVFDNADRFDIARSPNPHVAFGFGAHFCLGNQLARLELKVMFERLLARMPDIHLAAERATLPRRPANFISGFEAMPVAFTPSAPLGRRAGAA